MDKENANAGEEDDQPESKATPHSPLYSTPGAKRPNPFKVHLTDIHVCTDNLAHSRIRWTDAPLKTCYGRDN